MSTVTITINGKNFHISCGDDQEELVKAAAAKLSTSIEAIKVGSPTASTELLLIMCALGLQDENESLRNKVGDTALEDSLRLSETLSTIAGYLEELANKIKA